MKKDSPILRQRKRGVRASRIKLEQSMVIAGFRTQASLAEAIAEKENIENAPKDFVSKVFREIPVAPASIERIASVMGVEAYELYRTKKDDLQEPQEIIPPNRKIEIIAAKSRPLGARKRVKKQ